MSSDTAIKVENVSKCFQIYGHPKARLKQMLVPRFRRFLRLSSKSYFHEFWALQGVSFEIKKGETVGIIGRNGSGKSTLLQIICGTLTPTSGTVVTHGRVAALLELGSGFNPEFTGRENVYLNGALLGLSKQEIDNRFAEIAEFAEIGEFIEQPIKKYSSGMVVRLAFAVQAMIVPDIFVIDEALAVGDEKFQRKCYARLEYLKSQGTSILFVSHSPSSVIELCDRALLLHEGERLLYCGATEAIRAYQKIIYAPADVQKQLTQQLLLEDQSNKLTDVGLSESESVANQKSLSIVQTDVDLAGDTEELDKAANEAFDSGLIPESTMVYEVQGAEISKIEIRNALGEKVNILQPGAKYEFIITGRFLENCRDVYFGIHIRSISGVVITGQRFPAEGNFLKEVTSGQLFKSTFSFKIDMLPGVYFVGCGIWSAQEPNCLHRILDAYMLRVLPEAKQISFGYADMSTREPNVEFF